MKELDKRIKRKICALGLLGLFVVMVFAQTAIAHLPGQVSWDVGGNAFGGTGSTQNLGTTTRDDLAILANGIQGVVIDGTVNAGHVGIGMGGARPTARLHVVGIGNTQATTTFRLMDSGWTTLMEVEDGGNVGIGTASPQNKLDVEGGAVIGATYSGTNTAPTNGLLVEGNVGIGTIAPVTTLDVNGGLATNTITVFPPVYNVLVPNNDFTILADATTGPITVNLPPAALVDGQILVIKKIDVGVSAITILPSPGETIDGMPILTWNTPYTSYMIQADTTSPFGPQWYII